MKATFTVDAYSNERFTGVVRQIRNAPLTVQNVVTYDAVIDVQNPDLKLRPGMTANVTFVYAKKEGVLRVPNGALRFRPPPDLVQGADGGVPAKRPRVKAPADRRTVWVADGERVRPIDIRIGVSDGTNTEVLDGDLRDGQSLVVDVVRSGKKPEGRRAAGMRRIL
jgi:HlyD family secretion protein